MEYLQLFFGEVVVALALGENSARFLPVSTTKMPAWAKTTAWRPLVALPLHNKYLSHARIHQ